jgi:DNA-binding NarL/FixJ family response regulator
MKVYKQETREVIRLFLARKLSFPDCIAALDAALADLVPRLRETELPTLRALMLADNEIVMKDAAKHNRPDPQVKLSKRQLEIALLMADGLSSKEIATRLDVSAKTVEFHRREIYQKLGLKRPALIVRWLIREDLLEP